MQHSFQGTSQNDPIQIIQMQLDQFKTKFKNEVKCYAQKEKEKLKQKQNDANDEMDDEDEQEEKKENYKRKVDLIQKKKQKTIQNFSYLISLYNNFFKISQKQIKNSNNQIQQNQINHQQIQELMQEFIDILSQQQMDFPQFFFSILLKQQQSQQSEIVAPPESAEYQKLKQLIDIFSIVNKAIEKQEDFDTRHSEQPSDQFSKSILDKDIPKSEYQQKSRKIQIEIDTEKTIKKGNKQKKKNINEKYRQYMRNYFDKNLKQNINNSDAKYSYNHQIFPNNKDFYKCQFEYNNIVNRYNHILSQLSKWLNFRQKLSIQIDLTEQPNQMINPNQFQMSFQMSLAKAIIFDQNSEKQQKIDQTMTLWMFKFLDMIIKICDMYQVEVQKRQTNITLSQEYLKELQEFQQLLQENKKEFIKIKKKYNEALPLSDENIGLIQEKILIIDKGQLKAIISGLENKKFYVKSFVANGGEADILKGSFFIKDEKKQKCIFRCIDIKHESLEQIQKEYDLVRSIQQPKNIIQYFDKLSIEKIENVVIFIVEECQNSLLKEIKQIQENNKIEVIKVFQIMFDLIEGLIELRIHKIVHADIKPANILISQKGYYVLSDFGLACILEDEENGVEAKGYSNTYSSQEQLEGRVKYKSDIYSLGVTIIILIQRLDQINCTPQTKQIMTNFKEQAEKYMIQDDQNMRLDCLQMLEKFHEIIFSKDYQSFQSFLKPYLQKVELFINNNNFEFSQQLKDLKNFDYEYYKKVLYFYCILYIRISFFINGVEINNSQIEEKIQNNSLGEYNIEDKQIPMPIIKLGDYFREQNDYLTALQYYKQSLIFQNILEINNFFSHTVDKIILSFTKLSEINECLEYLLEQNEICEVIFNNVKKSYFVQNIKQICQNIQKDNDLQSMLKGLDSLTKYKKQFIEEYIMLLRQIIEIYKIRNDNQNQLQYLSDLLQTIDDYCPNFDDSELQKLMEELIQLQDQ